MMTRIREITAANTGRRTEISEINTIVQRLAAIEGEIKELETLTNKRRSFDKHISNLAKDAISEAVRNFAHGRYDLIVNTRAKEILFNSNKGVLDVTQAIVEHYRESHMPSTIPSAPAGT